MRGHNKPADGEVLAIATSKKVKGKRKKKRLRIQLQLQTLKENRVFGLSTEMEQVDINLFNQDRQ